MQRPGTPFRPTMQPPHRLLTISLLAGSMAVLPACRFLDRPAPGNRQKQTRSGRVPTDQQTAGTDSMNRARILRDQGLEKEALAQFERAIMENPLLVGAHMGAGEINFKQGNIEAAAENFGTAARLEENNFSAQFWYGVALQELKRLDEAIRQYLRALRLRPDDFQANSNLGVAYLQAGEPSEALPYAQRAIELNPDDGPSRTNLGAVYAALGQYENAITEFQQAAELTDLSPPLLLNLADAYGRMKRYDEMVNTLQEVIRLEPSAAAYERMGSGLFRMGDYEGSLAAFRKAVELDERHYPAHNGVGVCLLRDWMAGGQEDETLKRDALKSLRRSLQIEKNQPKVLELVARFQ
jgi:tetratricopeptide (TPR) repeat protein